MCVEYSLKARTYLARNSDQEGIVRGWSLDVRCGENQLLTAIWAFVTHFLRLKHMGPQLSTRHGCDGASRAGEGCGAAGQREGKPWPPLGRAWRGSIGKGERMWAETLPTGLSQRDVTHLRDLFAILQVPHRRGLGGDAVQPPPASSECSLSPTLQPLPLAPSPRRPRVERTSPAGQDGGADRDPPPARSAAPSPGPARSGMPPTCQQARSRPPPAPPAASQPLRSGPCSAPRRVPTPALNPQRAALQGSLPPAGFCPHRRISRPASLKSRRLNLRTRPGISLAVAAARGGTRAGRRERARLWAGLGSWKSGLELAGVGEGARSQGVGPQGGLAGIALTGPGARRAPHRAGPAGKTSSGGRLEVGPEAAARVQTSRGSRTRSLGVGRLRRGASPQPPFSYRSSTPNSSCISRLIS